MPYLNQITHPTDLAQRKVNFFADYFQYATNQIGNFDCFEIENFQSLIEKIIYQASENLERCPQYLNNYIAHPLFDRNNKYFKEFKSYRSVRNYFTKYLKNSSDSQRVSWIKRTPRFLKALSRFRNELRRNLFKKALNAIISFLKCTHEIEEHQADLIHYTNVLVSEFLFNDRAKSDTTKIFERIITREIKDFPFPKSFLERNKESNLEEAKSEFIKNRTFNQQFEGIYNVFQQQHSRHFFLFRVYNIQAPENFSFKYNKVSFYHPKHSEFKALYEQSQKSIFHKDFFNQDTMLIAVVNAKYFSSEIAERNAVIQISNELPFLNKICNSNAYLEKHSYMITSNFKTFGGRWSRDEKPHFISRDETKQLKDNPYRFLKKVNPVLKNHLLKYEPLFIDAINSNDISDYWHYLETLIKPTSTKVIDPISTILLFNAQEFYEKSLHNYILNCVSHFHYPESLIGLTKERQQFFYRQLSSKGKLNFDQLLKEVKHPFINYLSNLYTKKLTSEDFKIFKLHYERILVETYAQRNGIIHKGEANEKPLITIFSTLPRLVMRFRWLLYSEMKKNSASSFGDLIINLKNEGQKLI